MKKKVCLIDTNIILRFLIGDIPSQLEKSKKLFKEIEAKKSVGIVSLLVVNELIWIFEHFYEKKRDNFIPQILKLISLKNIKILETKKKELILILRKFEKTSFDFIDLYLSYFAEKLKFQLVSFDKKLLKTFLD